MIARSEAAPDVLTTAAVVALDATAKPASLVEEVETEVQSSDQVDPDLSAAGPVTAERKPHIPDAAQGKMHWLQKSDTIDVLTSTINLTRSQTEFRVRTVKKKGVADLVASMKEFKAKNGVFFDPQFPVLLYETPDGYRSLILTVRHELTCMHVSCREYLVVDGRHRCTACTLLGVQKVQALVLIPDTPREELWLMARGMTRRAFKSMTL